jgi:hypothetical protein
VPDIKRVRITYFLKQIDRLKRAISTAGHRAERLIGDTERYKKTVGRRLVVLYRLLVVLAVLAALLLVLGLVFLGLVIIGYLSKSHGV